MARSKVPSAPLTLAFSCDDNYGIGLAGTLRSLLENLKKPVPVEVYVLDGGIKPATQKKLAASTEGFEVNFHFVKPDLKLAKSLPDNGYINFTTYFRMLVSDVLPKHVDKVLYLDADLMVLSDVMEIWNKDLSKHPLAAAQSTKCPYVVSMPGLPTFRELKLPWNTPYMGAGVSVINLKMWREKDLPRKLLAYVQEYKDTILLCDQDALNAVFANQWLKLDWKWNIEFEDVVSEGIVHFSGPQKAWMEGCRHPMQEHYFQYLDHTAWAGHRPKGGKVVPLSREQVMNKHFGRDNPALVAARKRQLIGR